MARFPFPHSYIGVQPAKSGDRLAHEARAVGVHHIALWARNRKEVDEFHQGFLIENAIQVTDAPQEYAVYTPGYYAVFFDDPINGVHRELAHIPFLPTPAAYLRSRRRLKQESAKHPEWRNSPMKEAMRPLPRKR